MLQHSKLKVSWWVIIESVDSNVGIARTRNIWQYIKISPNLKNGELISLYDNVLSIFECFHDQQDSQWPEKASRKYPTKQRQNGQIVFLSSSFFLSSDGLAQHCVNLSRWFTHETAAYSTEQCTTPSPLTSKPRKAHVATHLNITASNLGRHFLCLYSFLYGVNNNNWESCWSWKHSKMNSMSS